MTKKIYLVTGYTNPDSDPNMPADRANREKMWACFSTKLNADISAENLRMRYGRHLYFVVNEHVVKEEPIR